MMSSRPQRGYTLLELIVTIGLFSMVMLVVTSAYLTLIAADRQARAVNSLVANLSFGVESMARNIRTGRTYACTGSPCNQFSFTDSQGQQITYRLKSDGSLGQCTNVSCTADSNAVALTDSRIVINTLRFYLTGESTADTLQPNVMVVIRGTLVPAPGKSTTFVIQTTATQRVIDI